METTKKVVMVGLIRAGVLVKAKEQQPHGAIYVTERDES